MTGFSLFSKQSAAFEFQAPYVFQDSELVRCRTIARATPSPQPAGHRCEKQHMDSFSMFFYGSVHANEFRSPADAHESSSRAAFEGARCEGVERDLRSWVLVGGKAGARQSDVHVLSQAPAETAPMWSSVMQNNELAMSVLHPERCVPLFSQLHSRTVQIRFRVPPVL